MAIDLTQAATLSGVVNQNLPAPCWLQKKFFGTKVHDTLQIGVDIIKGSRKLAPFRRIGQESTTVSSDSIVTKWFGPNQISLKAPTTAFDMAKRAAGQQISYADGIKTIDERIAFKVAQDSFKLTQMIRRTVGKMCADALFTNIVNNYDANGNLIESFDMGVDASHIKDISGESYKWSAGSNAHILEDIDEWATLIADDSGLPATDCVVAPNVATKIRTNELVLKQLSTNTGTFAMLNPVKPEPGAQFLGYTASGIRLWCCTETYEDSTGTKQNMVPDGYALVISDMISANVHYGMIEDRKAGSFVGEIFAKTWEEEDPSVQWLKCASAPLAYVEQPDGLVYAKVM